MPPQLPPIDFRRIRTKPPRYTEADGFEELYSQLLMDGQLVNFPPGTRFERFGNPDGGREGRAILLDGQVWCWQSKYQWSFESSAGLNESYERAFSLEPHMTRYLVGMPIDLPAGDTERARSAQTKWIDWVIQKTSELPEGRSMEFEFHGENAFNLALLRPGNVGYLRYWFDRDSFAPSDFERLYGRARDIAGPRYTEELNVGVPLADVIRAFAGDAGALDSMLAALGQLRARAIAEVHFEDDPHRDELTELSVRVVGATTHLDQAVVEALETVAARRQPSSLDGAINAAVDAIRALQARAYEIRDPREDTPVARLERDVDRLYEAVSSVRTAARASGWRVLGQRALLITGVGGAGKTHLLVDAVRERVERGLPAFAVMGEQVTRGPIEDELSRLVGFTGPAADLLRTLDIAGASAGTVALIVVDGLNETLDRSIWATYLDAFLIAAAEFEHVRVIVSCRTEYLDDTISANARTRAVAIEHRGFAQAMEDAVAKFADWYGLDRPTFPLLIPEFVNPLLLKLACEAVRGSGDRAFPRVASGLSWIVNLIIGAVELRLAHSSRCDFTIALHPVRRLCEWFASQVADGDRYLPLADVAAEAERLLPGREWSRSLVVGLLREGVFTDFKSGDEEMLRFAYERFGDVLTAASIANRDSADRDAECRRRAKSWYQHAGVLDALSVVLPEQHEIELIDVLGEQPPARAVESFAASLQWRSGSSISARSIELLRYLLQGEYSDAAWDALLTLAPLDGHPLNADFLHAELTSIELHERDAGWTLHVNHDLEGMDVIGRLSDWAWSSASADASHEVAQLSAIALSWSLSSSRRKTRDNASKALIALLERHSSVARSVAQAFSGVNDPYIEERLFAAFFGSTARRKHDHDHVMAIADALASMTIDRDYWPAHLLTRHYARKVFDVAAEAGWARATPVLMDQVHPPYSSALPETRLSQEQVEAMNGAPDYAYSSIGHSVLSDYGDFRKYVINHPVQGFRLPEAIDVQHFSHLVFERVLDLGWAPDRFGDYDRRLRDPREQEDRIERIGKKYQWIAFWQLLSALTDNFEIVDRFTEAITRYDEPIDVDVPDVDPTLMVRYRESTSGYQRTPNVWFAPVALAMPAAIQHDWLEDDNFVPDPRQLVQVADPDGGQWTVLEGHYSWEQKRSLPTRHGESHFVWMQVRSYIIGLNDLSVVESWAADQDWYGRWMPESGDPYGLYLADHPYSIRWRAASATDDYRQSAPVSVEVTTTSYGGMGGSWDYSDSRSVTGLLPATGICERLGIEWSGDFKWSPDGGPTTVANFGSLTPDGPNAVFARSEVLATALAERREVLFVTVLAEKGTYRDSYDNIPSGTPFSRSYSASFVLDGGLRRIAGVARQHLAGTGTSGDVEEWVLD